MLKFLFTLASKRTDSSDFIENIYTPIRKYSKLIFILLGIICISSIVLFVFTPGEEYKYLATTGVSFFLILCFAGINAELGYFKELMVNPEKYENMKENRKFRREAMKRKGVLTRLLESFNLAK